MQPNSDPIGQRLNNRYEILSLLGSGASANVYLAQDSTLERHVAIKVLQPSLAVDEQFLTRFRSEARSVAALNHPHVLRVFDWGEETGIPYLVTEYLPGGSLKDLLEQSVRLTPEQAALIGQQAASGIAYAHTRGIVHSAITPTNLLFDDEGRVRITDFGIARALAESSWIDPVGSALGTARYASPEQALSASIDEKADVYSLGLVLYEAMTGVVPFVGETPISTMTARIGQELPEAPALGPLAPLLVQACASEVSRRLNATEFEERLTSVSLALPPAQPLPLAAQLIRPEIDDAQGMGGAELGALGTLGFRAPSPDQLTQVNAVVSHDGPVRAGVTTSVPSGGDGAVSTFRDEFEPLPAFPTGRRRRRWPWIVGVLVVALIAFGGYAFATKLFVASVTVPHVVGETQSQAVATLKGQDLTAVFSPSVYSLTIGPGKIVAQTPQGGWSLKQGSSVNLVASRGLPPEKVPSLSGMTCTQAQSALLSVHLKGVCPTTDAAYSPTVPVNQVVNYVYNGVSNPATVPYGATVTLVISQGPPPLAIPQVSGTYAQAQATLTASGFVAAQASEYSATIAIGQVTRTSPPVGSLAQKGSTVTVYISLGPSAVVPASLLGETYSAASATLRGVGLYAKLGTGPTSGHVISTLPGLGSTVAAGSTVTVNLK